MGKPTDRAISSSPPETTSRPRPSSMARRSIARAGEGLAGVKDFHIRVTLAELRQELAAPGAQAGLVIDVKRRAELLGQRHRVAPAE